MQNYYIKMHVTPSGDAFRIKTSNAEDLKHYLAINHLLIIKLDLIGAVFLKSRLNTRQIQGLHGRMAFSGNLFI